MSLKSKRSLFAEPEEDKKTIISYKDVMMAYFRGGVPLIRDTYHNEGASVSTVERAIKELIRREDFRNQEDKRDAANFIKEISKKKRKNRASTIKVGEVRKYKGIATKENPKPWGRIPVHFLGVKWGEHFKVTFKEDKIIIEKDDGEGGDT